ncbi:MAG: hypothetical protein M3362_21415, partial [Acidobacteriota bacterium]|nr:hypothetical protein [Acidobacteriota bacterium]
ITAGAEEASGVFEGSAFGAVAVVRFVVSAEEFVAGEEGGGVGVAVSAALVTADSPAAPALACAIA